MSFRKMIPFALLVTVLVIAACAPVTPMIPETGVGGQNGQAGQSGQDQDGQNGQGQSGQNGEGGQGQNNSGGTGTGSNGSMNGGTGLNNGSTAPSPTGSLSDMDQNLRDSITGFASEQFGGNNSDFEILWAQQMDFPNGCLGVATQGENCSQAITPGWQVVARSGETMYVFHASSNGSNVRWNQNADANTLMSTGNGQGSNQGGSDNTGDAGNGKGGNQSGSDNSGNSGGSTGSNGNGGSNQGGVRVSLDQVITLASQFLGQTLNVPISQVAFTGVSVETWSDSCLGAGQANESCLQATTPGYRVMFSVGGQPYELRTDNTGSSIRLVQGVQQ